MYTLTQFQTGFSFQNMSIDANVEFVEMGGQLVLCLTLKDQSDTRRPIKEAIIQLGDAANLVDVRGSSSQPTGASRGDIAEMLADLLPRTLADWKKKDGIYQPKDGETLIVDKPKSPHLRIYDPDEEAFEKIPKKKITVEARKCICDAREFLVFGCRCKGV